MQQQQPPNRTRGGRNLHIAHRRSPSELTPLMVEQLALQRQIEILQAQQQQMLAQNQQFAQAGLLPQSGLLPPQPTMIPQLQPPFPYSQFQPQISSPNPQGHRRAQSSLTPSNHLYSSPQNNQALTPGLDSRSQNTSQGHNRRHSLALSEAKKAAAIAQAKRSGSPSEGPSKNPVSTNSPPTQTDSQNSSFKFPNTPDKESPSSSSSSSSPATFNNRSHSRSQSLQFPNKRNNQYNGSSSQGGFQFPAIPQSSQPDSGPHDYYRPNHSHQRSNSRNLDSNWRQPLGQHQQSQSASLLSNPQVVDFPSPQNQFMPGHRSGRSFNNSISSIQAFSMYPPNQFQPGHSQQPSGQQGNQRKSLFAPYLPQASLPGLLADGRLVAGVLRVNKKNRSDAYVSTDGLLDADIFICGSKDRNRALEGDLVAVELLEVDEVWDSKKEKEEKKKRKDAADESRALNTDSGASSPNTTGTGLRRRGSLKQRPTQKKNDDVEVEGQSLLLVEEEALSDEIKPLYAGHVVAVIDRFPGQMFSGTLGLLRPSSQATKNKQDAERKERGQDDQPNYTHKPKIVWFKPTDKRVPLIAIPTEQAPIDFVENSAKYADKIFVASIKRWPITSLHPFGTLVEILGSNNDVNIDTEAILRDNNFTADIFSENILSELAKSDEDQKLSDEESDLRRDFSSEYIIAFSPFDDSSMVEQAVHVKKISDSKVELGIHTVDVSYFCSENSHLDREARKRGTSVFLKQRTVPMFPKAFQEYVSFKSDKRTAAISVIFEMDPKTCEITDTWIGESLVTSKRVLTYSDVASVLDETSGSNVSQAEVNYIKTLRYISDMFRKQRLGLEEADLPILGLLNYVDDEAVNVSSNIFDGSSVSQILDEINIKVNCAIAQKSFAVWGSMALLRRHSVSILQKIESFIESVKNLNIEIDTTSSATIQQGILNIKDDVIRKGLEALLYKCMARARYFVGEKNEPENQSHYFLNVPLYTHFTAPLRRYADVVVHRQVRAFIRNEPYTPDVSELTSIADSCTFKKDCAKNAQEQSIHLDVCQKIEKRAAITGQLVIDSIVIQVYESAFDVLIPEYGIEKRVHGDQLPLRKAEFDKKTRYLELYWEGGIDSATYVPDDEKNGKGGTRGRVRASSAASALAQEQMMIKDNQLDLSKLNLDKKKDEKEEKEADKILAPFFENVVTRIDKGEKVQEISVLKHVPVLLRAELGKSIPCLTVRALNPFTK